MVNGCQRMRLQFLHELAQYPSGRPEPGMISRPKKRKRPPFVVAFKVVMRNAKLSLAARALLVIIRSYANSDGTNCFPSIETLRKVAGCPRRTLERYLSELRKAQLIHTEQRSTKGNQRSSNIFILFDEEYARIMYKPPARKTARNGGRTPPPMADGEDSKILDFTEVKRLVI
jgi:hypothetical protein